MELHTFLESDSLRLGKTGQGIERQMVDLTERHGLHECLTAYDPVTEARICQVTQTLHTAVELLLTADRAQNQGLAVPGGRKGLRKYLRGVRYGLTKWDDQKLREVAALALQTNVLDEPSDVFVHDACSGKGPVLTSVSVSRGEPGRTRGISWEHSEDSRFGFELLRELVAGGNPGLEFRVSAIREADLSAYGELPTYVLAKHACGNATDDVLAAVRALPLASRPRAAAVLSCCHAKAASLPQGAGELITVANWRRLTRHADPRKGDSEDPYSQTLMRVAMRIIDTIRLRALGTGVGTLCEVLPGDVSVKNQAFVLS